MSSPRASINSGSARGFTLLEILLVVGLLALLGGIGTFVGLNSYRTGLFRSERDTVVGLLWEVRGRALNNVDETPHGLKINDAGYTVFEGSSYAARVPAQDETTPVNSSFGHSGLDEVVFSQLSGSVSAPGVISLTDGSRSFDITINHEGGIDW